MNYIKTFALISLLPLTAGAHEFTKEECVQLAKDVAYTVEIRDSGFSFGMMEKGILGWAQSQKGKEGYIKDDADVMLVYTLNKTVFSTTLNKEQIRTGVETRCLAALNEGK